MLALRSKYPFAKSKKLTLLLPLLLVGISCGLFEARTPEAPLSGKSTWLQPDTPERVVENIQNSVREMNSQNYHRSLVNEFSFKASLEADSREPLLWAGWAAQDELSYFQRLVGAASNFNGHDLELVDATPTVLSESVYLFEADYLLTVNHSRVDEDIPTEYQGRLTWKLVQGEDGLWALEEWIDVNIGSAPSWSDLKASFST